jgi:membrane-associated phospholipid phosphatase
MMLRRAATLWRLKLALTVLVPPVFLLFYLTIQRLDWFPSRTLALTWIDEAAGFSPHWIWVYVSQYVIIPVPPLMAVTRQQLWRLIAGVTWVSLPSFAVFLFFPVLAPRPPAPSPGESNFMYDWITAVDTPGNAFPSLHVGLSSLVAFYAHRIIGREFGSARPALLTIFWLWTAAIAWSTMATKQHYFADVVGGFVVAAIGHWLAWRK